MISFGLVHRVVPKLPPSFKIHVLFLKLGKHRVGEQPLRIAKFSAPNKLKFSPFPGWDITRLVILITYS